jgi:hypothetical protein
LGLEDKKIRSFKCLSSTNDTILFVVSKKKIDETIVWNNDDGFRAKLKEFS